VLRRISLWVLFVTLARGGPAAMAQSQIQVGANVLVTKDDAPNNHFEVLGAADPHNPEQLLVCSMVSSMEQGTPWTAAYVSFDSGKNWSKTLEQKGSGEGIAKISSDPACAYGSNGTAYFVALSDSSAEANTIFFRSVNGGKDWSSPVTLFGAWDRPFIAVDATVGQYQGRIYVSHAYIVRNMDTTVSTYNNRFDSASGIALQRSLDGGRTFIGPVARMGLDGVRHENTNPGNSVVLSDGTLVTLFVEGDLVRRRNSFIGDMDGSLKILSSRDGGESYGDAVKVADHFEDRNRNSMSSIPRLAVDPGSPFFKDRLYVVWHDSGPEREEGFVSFSSDKGKSWSRPIKFVDAIASADPADGPDEFQTTVAVNKDGLVGIMWYEGITNPVGGGYWVRFTASVDGGETWLPSIRISEAPNTIGGSEKWPLGGRAVKGDPLTVRLFRQVWQASGDTAGLTADSNGVFHAFWIDNRTGIGQVWTAPITILGNVFKNGARELANLEDVSKEVIVEVRRVSFDPSSNTLSAVLRLKNISAETIAGPFELRILALSSDLCIPQITNAGNGARGNGAILHFSSNHQGAVLKSEEFSMEKEINFKLLDLKSFRSNKKRIGPLVQFDARVFAQGMYSGTQ